MLVVCVVVEVVAAASVAIDGVASSVMILLNVGHFCCW